MEKGTVHDFSFYSEELKEQLEILVYLPPQFTPLRKYPICIAQDGKDYFQLGRVARTLDELIQSGEMEAVLFFGIPYKNVEDRRQKYHPFGSKQHHYIRFLAHELVPFIEKNYPVISLGNSRALAGDSLGATVSLMTALQYPNSFGKVMLHSPFVDEKVIESVRNFSNWQSVTIYHVIGQQETEVKMTDGKIADFLTPNRTLSEYITLHNTTYFYDEFNGNHTWKYWQSDLKRALTQLFPFE